MNYFNIPIACLLSSLCLISCNHDDSTNDYVKVYKYDGSIQCESSGIELEIMAQELITKGIDVICSQKGHDGLDRTAVCGADTGLINIYTIYSSNLNDAENTGFKSVSVLSEYQDEECN